MPLREHTFHEAPAFEPLEPRTLLSAVHVPAACDIHSPPACAKPSIVGQLATVTPVVTSTIPDNGDLNPYGVAFVPKGFAKGGPLNPGDVLVSNFNSSDNLQGTGTTIVRIQPDGTLSTFFQGPAGLGLTTALGILKGGFVIVGNMPTTDGTSDTVQPGSLLILDRFGNEVTELTDSKLIDGPWDLTVNEQGRFAQVFVSNVLSGTVSRFDLQEGCGKVKVLDSVQIASGYTHQPDPAALELGPTGLAFDPCTQTLYVASTADNEIFALRGAGFTQHDLGTGKVLINDPTHLHGPLGLVQAPNGDLIVANGDAVNADPAQPSEIVEFTKTGKFVSQYSLDPNPAGPFGIALSADRGNGHVHFAAVNDNQNTLSVWDLKSPGKCHSWWDFC